MRSDFNLPHLTLAALLTNEDNQSAIVAIPNSRFLINNDLYLHQHPQQPDNIHFALNSIEWLSDNSGLIQLRNKFTTYTTLKSVERGRKLFIQYLNFLLPIFMISIFGAFWFQNLKNKRTKRRSEGYID